MSLKEVVIKSLSQSTSSNKPILSRVPRKLRQERLEGAWTTPVGYDNPTNSLSPNSFVATPGGTQTRVAQQLSALTVGSMYRIEFIIEAVDGAGIAAFI